MHRLVAEREEGEHDGVERGSRPVGHRQRRDDDPREGGPGRGSGGSLHGNPWWRRSYINEHAAGAGTVSLPGSTPGPWPIVAGGETGDGASPVRARGPACIAGVYKHPGTWDAIRRSPRPAGEVTPRKFRPGGRAGAGARAIAARCSSRSAARYNQPGVAVGWNRRRDGRGRAGARYDSIQAVVVSSTAPSGVQSTSGSRTRFHFIAIASRARHHRACQPARVPGNGAFPRWIHGLRHSFSHARLGRVPRGAAHQREIIPRPRAGGGRSGRDRALALLPFPSMIVMATRSEPA